MNLKQWHKLFDPSMRWWFSYDRAIKEGWPVELRVINSHKQLGKYYLPWSVGQLGNGGEAIKVKNIGSHITEIGSDSIKNILGVSETLMKTRTSSFLFPVLGYKKTGIIMDGAHRASALTLFQRDFTALMCVIQPKGIVWTPDDYVRNINAK